MVRTLGERMPERPKILDVGAGTGAYSLCFVDRRHAVTAVDQAVATFSNCVELAFRYENVWNLIRSRLFGEGIGSARLVQITMRAARSRMTGIAIRVSVVTSILFAIVTGSKVSPQPGFLRIIQLE